MIPRKKIATIFEHKMSLDEDTDKNNGQFGLKGYQWDCNKYRRKIWQRNFQMAGPCFNCISAGFCRLMTKLRNRTHCQESLHNIGKYLSDIAQCIIHFYATKTLI